MQKCAMIGLLCHLSAAIGFYRFGHEQRKNGSRNEARSVSQGD
jgi:hypothetical protein